MRLACIVAVAIAVFGCKERPRGVSVLALVATGSAYDGQLIMTEGYAETSLTGERLYLSREDAVYELNSSSVMLDLSDMRGEPQELQRQQRLLRGNYVTVVGRYHHFGETALEGPGYLDELQFLSIHEPR